MCKQVSKELRATGAESHNSFGQGETYHSILRPVYSKVSLTHQDLPSELKLALTVKAINDTAGPHGLVQSLLLFGVIPRIPGEEEICPNQSRRAEAMEIAREEYRQIVSRSRVRVALQRKPPPAANYRFIHKKPVYVYREKERHWTGHHLVDSSDAKQVFVDLGERTGPRSFDVAQAKPAKYPRYQICCLIN